MIIETHTILKLLATSWKIMYFNSLIVALKSCWTVGLPNVRVWKVQLTSQLYLYEGFLYSYIRCWKKTPIAIPLINFALGMVLLVIE